MLRSAALKLGTGLALVAMAISPAFGSSHREAPNITKMPKVDNTDVYAFRSYEPGRAAFTTIISNFQPGESPGGGPNYYTMDPDAVYEIMIDSNGDAVEDLTYQFQFSNSLQNGTGITINAGGKQQPIPLRQLGQISTATDPDLGEYEYFTVKQIQGDRRTGGIGNVTNATYGGNGFAKPFDNAGNKTIPNYPAYADQFIAGISIPGCATQGRVFAGQRAEGFAVNLGPIFDLVNFIPIQGAPDPVYSSGAPFPGGITQSDANQELKGVANVTSIAIELPTACITGNGNGVIGVWSSASLPQTRVLSSTPTYLEPDSTGGAFVQVSRLGNPLVNELVIGLPDKDLFNAVKPTADAALASYVTNPTFPEILDALFRTPVRAVIGGSGTLAPTNFPRNDLVAVYLTGIPSLNQMSTVTASEMLRLNTLVTATALADQRALGVVADDLAGFPNGRRPGDDVVDITLRVAMGRLCHPFPINTKPTQLGLCTPAQAPTGLTAYTDGAPTNARDFQNRFPYLNPALRGAPRPQTQP
ncbi:MAG: DUF4331 domain-containing protein [Sphingomonas sp.]|uniref:DUF4331 domain-containing protein n=1 Tax=Sphingomonas sp. TaxID=28214 RepID=UPI0017EB438B|nr:DUF4331 domain-containing protein [Sphingomonas sp.]MBA3667389.1 DUF4331 domain-containing protein [Sphingomonas sp.]